MQVLFRVDSSHEIGFGHLVRCLTLADELVSNGHTCTFACAVVAGSRASLAEERGFRVVPVQPMDSESQDADETIAALENAGLSSFDWVVVDGYGFGRTFESAIRVVAARVLVIDDMANRLHDSDVLVDQNVGRSVNDYSGLVPDDTRVLVGSRFALLRKQFVVSGSPGSRSFRNGIHRVLVTLGGTDPTNETVKVLSAISCLDHLGLSTVVVLPETAPHRAAVEAAVRGMLRTTLLGHVENMAEVMESSDLVVGAGGVMLLERAALGLPSVTVSVASNQIPGAKAASDSGATLWLGEARAVTVEDIAKGIAELVEDEGAVTEMSRRALDMMGPMPGRGSSIVRGLMECLASAADALRPVTSADRDLLRVWRNSDRVRMVMHNHHLVSAEEHEAWFTKAVRDDSRRLLIYECGDLPLGYVAFGKVDSSRSACEWGFYIGEEWAPKGSGTRMGYKALDYAFHELGVHRIDAEVLKKNAASVNYHVKMGFKRVGETVRDSAEAASPHDCVLMSLSAADWAERREHLSADCEKGFK